ncbi:putative spermidine synthase [Calothrix sp. NIES-2100]|uniref:spermine/spermidine synthase domain-containing protein n=1 Tax=Calothrix sp. NIES-2100 TaxID=1954172 RepID=UPI000B5EFA1D|nr:putative spermidine synthase [Calothrix sp. NIES-2100]
MPISLFVKNCSDGLAFYINGDLQFDTTDEAIYHELLVIPAVALAVERFPDTELRAVIFGGGDGLALKQVLRFPQVSEITLVDQSLEVLQLARTVFQPFNHSSMESDRLTVYVEEALNFVSKLADCSYHVVICDFTYPRTASDTSIHSLEWYQQVQRILYPKGILSVNAVSPELTPQGFWCLYQTLLKSGFTAKPLQAVIPSFVQHIHGIWGFFLASTVVISSSEVQAMSMPENLEFLTPSRLWQAFIFEQRIAATRHQLTINTLDCPQLFYYLLNSDACASMQNSGETVNFLDIQEASTGKIGLVNPFSIAAISQQWLAQMPQSLQIIQGNSPTNLEISQFLPIQHLSHNSQMNLEWLNVTQKLVGTVDISRLAQALERRTKQLPPNLLPNVQSFALTAQKPQSLPMNKLGFEPIFVVIIVIILIANLSSRDSAFGKGNTDNNINNITDNINSINNNFNRQEIESNSGLNIIRIVGSILMASGGIWLLKLLINYFFG